MTTRTRSPRGEGRCRTLTAVLLCCALAAAATEAGATVARYQSTPELVAGASTVVRGFVLERNAHWQGEWIVTDVVVAVDECWAGECAAGTVVVREIGGEVDGVGMLPLEPSALPVGDEVVVFGRQRGQVLELVGGAQGVFRIEAGSALARRDLASVANLPAVPEPSIALPALRLCVLRALCPVEEGR